MRAQVAAFVSRRWGVPESRVHVDLQPLHGGLESAVVLARIAADSSDASLPRGLVVKELRTGLRREADVYDWLWRDVDAPPAVRVLGREVGDDTIHLYLEEAQAVSSWPWAEPRLAAAVCRQLARLHDTAEPPRELSSWDYEAELARSAALTLDVALTACDAAGRRFWGRMGDLRRVVGALPGIRRRLLSGATTLIHGDVQPGNVILRRSDSDSDAQVVLIDWARARIGSPLEDIASWLHSLGCWEPQARRRHDSLMRAYLEARRVRRDFSTEVRADYWLASVSNGLSGAIRYHLSVQADPGTTAAARYSSSRALSAWERVVRRAAAILSTSPDRCR